jgi:hypothetical protein
MKPDRFYGQKLIKTTSPSPTNEKMIQRYCLSLRIILFVLRDCSGERCYTHRIVCRYLWFWAQYFQTEKINQRHWGWLTNDFLVPGIDFTLMMTRSTAAKQGVSELEFSIIQQAIENMVAHHCRTIRRHLTAKERSLQGVPNAVIDHERWPGVACCKSDTPLKGILVLVMSLRNWFNHPMPGNDHILTFSIWYRVHEVKIFKSHKKKR